MKNKGVRQSFDENKILIQASFHIIILHVVYKIVLKRTTLIHGKVEYFRIMAKNLRNRKNPPET